VSSRRELWLSLVAVLAITGVYFAVSIRLGVPEARGLFGHSLGILGFTLMIATETLYSIRKRATRRVPGRMSDWLQFHIFTGIVGPYMVFLHSAWAYRGLAGIVLLMTGVVVASGFVGRYIYTAVPRTADGLVLEAEAIEQALRQAEADLREIQVDEAGVGEQALGSGASLVLGRGLQDLRERWHAWSTGRRLDRETRARASRTATALRRLRDLRRQLASLATARRLLAVWHTVHIPLGMALFVAAFAHAGAALYYATLLR
jgi:hypothetical protein